MPDSLPVDEVLEELGAALDRAGAAVLVAEPGAGKTTRVPPWLARRHRGRGRILVLEPRRIAARAAASRMAEEAQEEVGERFGYQVRGEQRRGPRTEVLVVTEALLTRFVQSDPALSGVAAVVIDEFHERSVHADLALALVAEARQALREDLELVVMSATLDAEPVAAFLGGAPIVRVAGRTFPIEIEHRPPPDLRTPLAESARAAIGEARREGARGVLVFLPGMGEIRRLEGDLAERGYRPGKDVFALHGELPLEEQRRALRPTGEPRVILATNVAESALTVPDVDAVVDSGYLRRARHEPDLGFDRLEIERISKASAAQRAGRAGRTGPGRCFRLYSARDHAAFLDHEPAEIGRVDLAELRLLLLDWGVSDAADFGWFEAPPAAALAAADELLVVLGLAERREGGVAATDLGRRLAALPVHPRLAVLVHEARRRGVGEEGARIAALLADRDLRPRTDAGGAALRAGRSDLLDRLDALERAGRGPARRIEREARRLAGLVAGEPAGRTPARGEDREAALLRSVLCAYPDRVARRRRAGAAEARMVGGRGLRLDRASSVRDEEYFVAVSISAGRRGRFAEDLVRIASGVERSWLDEVPGAAVVRERDAVFDAATQRLVAREIVRFGDLVLEEKGTGALDPDRGAEVLLAALRETPDAVLGADSELVRLRRKWETFRTARPEEEWPPLDDEAVLEVLAPVLPGRRSFADLRALPLADLVRGSLPRDRLARLERELPDRVTLPAGGEARIDYEAEGGPVLRERVQRLFGLRTLPSLCGGRIPLLVELLAPNHRPVQRTADLAGFWERTYPQVRKDLRGRYPKHAWPERAP